MTIFTLYILIGSVVYCTTMDMWYRIRYKKREFYSPDSSNWFLGFIIMMVLWPIGLPFCTSEYFREMKNDHKNG